MECSSIAEYTQFLLLLAVLPHFFGFNAQFIKSIHISLKFKSIILNITTRTNQEITAPKTSPWELTLSQSEIRISICFCRASSISSCSHQEIVTGLVFFALRETMLVLLSKLQGVGSENMKNCKSSMADLLTKK
jgi:hypothetical protein